MSGTIYSPTLTTALGTMLTFLEGAYGPRDRSYTVLGIVFQGDRPQLWYPGDCQHIAIMLTDEAANDTKRATFQLAHEAVHLLAPSGNRSSNVAEEGLATAYSERVSADWHLGFRGGDKLYDYCKRQLLRLLATQEHAVGRIREIEPSFSAWTPDIIRRACPQAPQALAIAVCERFSAVEAQFLATGTLPPE